jgi:hypothetical protein
MQVQKIDFFHEHPKVIFGIVVFLYFIWYYATLPGSMLSVNKRVQKPSLLTALVQFIIYNLFYFILLAVLFSRDPDFFSKLLKL